MQVTPFPFHWPLPSQLWFLVVHATLGHSVGVPWLFQAVLLVRSWKDLSQLSLQGNLSPWLTLGVQATWFISPLPLWQDQLASPSLPFTCSRHESDTCLLPGGVIYQGIQSVPLKWLPLNLRRMGMHPLPLLTEREEERHSQPSSFQKSPLYKVLHQQLLHPEGKGVENCETRFWLYSEILTKWSTDNIVI